MVLDQQERSVPLFQHLGHVSLLSPQGGELLEPGPQGTACPQALTIRGGLSLRPQGQQPIEPARPEGLPQGRNEIDGERRVRIAFCLARDVLTLEVRHHSRVELTKFHTPPAVRAVPENAPANTLGIRRIMFAVDDVDDVVARLRSHGAELVGEIAQYEDIYRLCFLRGPEGIIIGLAQQLR
jgi:catechol 2,3-dioxygenase-like lactoylglutathione lyase family enzyme